MARWLLCICMNNFPKTKFTVNVVGFKLCSILCGQQRHSSTLKYKVGIWEYCELRDIMKLSNKNARHSLNAPTTGADYWLAILNENIINRGYGTSAFLIWGLIWPYCWFLPIVYITLPQVGIRNFNRATFIVKNSIFLTMPSIPRSDLVDHMSIRCIARGLLRKPCW